MATWSQALSKLAFFLVLLPFTLTYLHLRYTAQSAHLLFVGPLLLENNDIVSTNHIKKTFESLRNVYGMYHGVSKSNTSSQGPLFSRVHGVPSTWHVHWPSIAHASTILATPTSTLLRSSLLPDPRAAQIWYHGEHKKWCLQSSAPSQQFCSDSTEDSSSPISGIWTNDEDEGTSIVVSSWGAKESEQSSSSKMDAGVSNMFRRNPNKQSKRNRNLEQVLQRPTTTLLLALNICIAFIYWNRNTNPSHVAKVYNKIVVEGELWRSFSGATAHFEPLHLGFNMMTLYSLGTELEPSYGSIPFMFYNISLIPIATLIMMSIVYLQIKRTGGNAALGETSTVGYSGVLFAWMVIASLERSETCPVPFLPTVCFSTYEFWKFKFNVGPIVQLFVAQLIMKRVSFVGHLSGIIAGFALHWNLLPLELVQPAILIPALFLGYQWKARHLIPVRGQTCDDEEEEGSRFLTEDDDPTNSVRFASKKKFLDSRRHKRERDTNMHQLLVYTQRALVVSVVLSAYVVDVLGGMFLSPILSLVLFHFCVTSHALLLSDNSADTEKSRLGTLTKGFILSCVLTVICDSMAIAGWIVARVYWQSSSGGGSSLVLACILLLFRLAVQLFSLCVACKNLSDIGETGAGGLFVVVFGYTVLENARIVGAALFQFLTKRSWTANEGRGISLGHSHVEIPLSSQVVL
jgi:membrane associated rhomboid family serine protease